MCLVDSSCNITDCYITENSRHAIKMYGTSIVACDHCDLSRNGKSPSICDDEYYNLDDQDDDCTVFLRNCTGDISSLPLPRKWIPTYTMADSTTLTAERDSQRVNAIIGQHIQVFKT